MRISENLEQLQPLLGRLAEMRKEDLDLTRTAYDRREFTRRPQQASMEVRRQGADFAAVPLIEYTHFGARIVLANATAGEAVDFLITTRSRTLKGEGRVAWTSTLSNGRKVAGLELTNLITVAKRQAGGA